MSAKELDRLEVLGRVLERRLTQRQAAEQLGLSRRQVERLCRALRAHGAAGLLWVPRAQRPRRAHQPRHRRSCLGELVQIDGCDHAWFEDRGPKCTLLVYVDDATSRLMELRFVASESAFDYFTSTRAYLGRYGKPVAFYSDKASIFRVATSEARRKAGTTQFGRALSELNIDIVCANTPQAKGRVERAHLTLQDRLVKELRLRSLSTTEAGNAYLLEFQADYNERFAREPRSAHDAHRPVRQDEDLERIFTWQEERKLSKNLTLHYKRVTYVVQPGPETLALAGDRCRVHEHEDGRIELRHEGRLLPSQVFIDPEPRVQQGDIVTNKRLGAVLTQIQKDQQERDRQRLASRNLTLRQKARIQAARVREGASPPHDPRGKAHPTFLLCREPDISTLR